MATLVLDASFVASLILVERHSQYAAEVFNDLATEPRIATSLLDWEISNILRTYRRRGELDAGGSAAAFDAYRAFDIRPEAPPDRSTLDRIGQLADNHALSAYDAGYLELSLRFGGQLATLDRNLARAAIAAGVHVHSPFA